MPYARPTLRALARQGMSDLASATGEVLLLRTSPLGILARAVAGLADGLYGYLDWIARMAVPWTAEDEHLAAWAALVGVERKPAAAATGSATFTGPPGSVLPEGTRLARAADGLLYLTTALGTVGAGGTVTVPFEATESGSAGNALDGAGVLIASAVPGINAGGVLAGPAAGGADAEGDDAFRDRVMGRFRAPPQGGAPGDYPAWALEVPGVTRAWAAPNGAGAGTVVVYVMLDEARAAQEGFPQGTDGGAAAEGRIAPATGDQLIVADHLYPLRPATALVHVVAPGPQAVNLVISDLSPDTLETRAAIAASVRGAFRRLGSPGGTVFQSDLVAAIDAAEGVSRFALNSPSVSITTAPGALPVLGTINGTAWD